MDVEFSTTYNRFREPPITRKHLKARDRQNHLGLRLGLDEAGSVGVRHLEHSSPKLKAERNRRQRWDCGQPNERTAFRLLTNQTEPESDITENPVSGRRDCLRERTALSASPRRERTRLRRCFQIDEVPAQRIWVSIERGSGALLEGTHFRNLLRGLLHPGFRRIGHPHRRRTSLQWQLGKFH
jgi:hypothetical protein